MVLPSTMLHIYRNLIAALDRMVPARLQNTWNHPAGPKTVFFWAPTCKWGLVIAGLGDLTRPAEKLSTSQSAALAVTGTIWSRYCLVITPINYYLMSVNMFVALTGMYQLSRIWNYNKKQKEAAGK
ncbi:unnamed protein product [Darwinula stevensoni]|uniref:Mitochondrial pyruvate carrier n=1 Tax=Darwinula stevensoni TaxID=69355 RepID=A0A7R9A5M3_9CRUS|nr:unnamed protein product [Darwinula stevensoni]CAG0886781.1 unnamed protein product [Darwinula stevensoni]